MPTINNIPQAMIDEHVAWHNNPGNASSGGRAIDPFPPIGRRPALGSGEEFLVWHSGFIDRFQQWVNGLPAGERPPADAIAPWNAVPQMLKMSMLGWNVELANEEQLLSDMWNFDSLDELGRFLEWSLHGFLHGAASQMWNEPILLSYESPRSTYFWKLHGLIEHWHQEFINRQVPTAQPQFVPLQIDGAEVEASIGSPGEIDRFQFFVGTPNNLTVATSGPSDTVIYLAGPDNPQLLRASNDDGGEGFNASITADLGVGTYFVYVVFYNPNLVGDYKISVRS